MNTVVGTSWTQNDNTSQGKGSTRGKEKRLPGYKRVTLNAGIFRRMIINTKRNSTLLFRLNPVLNYNEIYNNPDYSSNTKYKNPDYSSTSGCRKNSEKFFREAVFRPHVIGWWLAVMPTTSLLRCHTWTFSAKRKLTAKLVCAALPHSLRRYRFAAKSRPYR